jgi:hypothetical protein
VIDSKHANQCVVCVQLRVMPENDKLVGCLPDCRHACHHAFADTGAMAFEPQRTRQVHNTACRIESWSDCWILPLLRASSGECGAPREPRQTSALGNVIHTSRRASTLLLWLVGVSKVLDRARRFLGDCDDGDAGRLRQLTRVGC